MKRIAWRQLHHSLGARLVGVFLLLALTMAATFLVGMQNVLHGSLQNYARPLVADYIDKLTAEIGTPPDIEKARALTQRLPLHIRIEGPQVNWDSHPLERRALHGEHHFPPHSPGADRSDGGDPNWHPWRLLADGHRISYTLADLSHEGRPRIIGWITLSVLLLLTVVAYLYVRRLLRPLQDIRSGAIRYGQGDFAQTIIVRQHDELGELAGQINTMAAKLHHMLEAKRQLLLAISHELRSPLTRARLNLELVDEGDARDALLRDMGEMRDLIDDLLESERLAQGHAALHRDMTDLPALAQELIATHFAGRTLQVDLDDVLPPLALDQVRIRLLLRNLLDNALRHGAGADAAPQLSIRGDADTLIVVVRDHGPGVDEDLLPHLADAFYRADAARQRATGGVGLGLYLCKLVAEAHGGHMSIRNAHPGLEICVTLPMVS